MVLCAVLDWLGQRTAARAVAAPSPKKAVEFGVSRSDKVNRPHSTHRQRATFSLSRILDSQQLAEVVLLCLWGPVCTASRPPGCTRAQRGLCPPLHSAQPHLFPGWLSSGRCLCRHVASLGWRHLPWSLGSVFLPHPVLPLSRSWLPRHTFLKRVLWDLT